MFIRACRVPSTGSDGDLKLAAAWKLGARTKISGFFNYIQLHLNSQVKYLANQPRVPSQLILKQCLVRIDSAICCLLNLC